MTQIKKVKTSEGVQFYPQTHTKAVIDDNGYTAESRLGAMQDEINQAQLAVGAVPSDLTPTEGSSNWVTSGGVYNAINVSSQSTLDYITDAFKSKDQKYIYLPYDSRDSGILRASDIYGYGEPVAVAKGSTVVVGFPGLEESTSGNVALALGCYTDDGTWIYGYGMFTSTSKKERTITDFAASANVDTLYVRVSYKIDTAEPYYLKVNGVTVWESSGVLPTASDMESYIKVSDNMPYASKKEILSKIGVGKYVENAILTDSINNENGVFVMDEPIEVSGKVIEDYVWQNYGMSWFFPVTAYSVFRLKNRDKAKATYYTFLTTNSTDGNASYAEGYNRYSVIAANDASWKTVIAPENAAYLYVGVKFTSSTMHYADVERFVNYDKYRRENANSEIGVCLMNERKQLNPLYGYSKFIPVSRGDNVEWGYGDAEVSTFQLGVYDTEGNYVDYYSNKVATVRVMNPFMSSSSITSFLIRASYLLSEKASSYLKVNGELVWAASNDDGGISDGQLLLGTFNSAYNTDFDENIRENFCKNMEGKEDVESFLFFSDPHLSANSRYEVVTELARDKYISTLQKYYNSLPLDNCICGGDLLNYHDTKKEACNELGYYDGIMRKLFRNYRPCFGNHDFAPYDASHLYSVNPLVLNDVKNLWFRQERSTYYSFEGSTTTFYVLNSGASFIKTMTDSSYPTVTNIRWEQVDWFANKLLTDDREHSVVLMHMYSNGTPLTWYTESYDKASAGIFPFSKYIREVAIAYNNRTSITKNGNIYDFSACTGRVMFFLCGHSHFDFIDASMELPVVCITNLEGGVWNPSTESIDYELIPTFDCCLLDNTNGVLYNERVGAGCSRIITCFPQSMSAGNSLTLTPKISGTITWESDNTSVATVSDGVVTGVSSGVCGVKAINNANREEYFIIKVN